MREVAVASSLVAGGADGSGPASRNAADCVFINLAQRPEHVAMRRQSEGGWRDVTTRAFADEVMGLAKGLLATGIEAGERVALMSRTRYEWTVADLALLTVGAVVVPIYETSSAEQVEWILTDAGVRAAFVETTVHRDLVDQARPAATGLGDVWVFDEGAIATLTDAGAAVTDDEVHARRALTSLDDLASILYTSGTTGRPKGCELTHANFIYEVSEAIPPMAQFVNESTSTLMFVPIAHVLGRVIELGMLTAGCTLGHTPTTANLVADLQQFQPTFVLSVPRVFEKVYNSARQRAQASGKGKIFDAAARTAVAYSRALDHGPVPLPLRLRHQLFDHLVYGKLRAALGGRCVAAVSGGAPLGDRLGHFFRGLGLTIYEGYGLTETTAAICVNTVEHQRIGTVGRPVPGASARVGDDGELLFKGSMVFRGYWNNPVATKEAIDDDGWFHSGDIGEIDDDGYVSITGRKKELIVTANGKNVAPAVLEDRARAHWLIDQVMVVGDRQPFIAALVTIDPDAFPQWLAQAGRPADSKLADLVDDPQLRDVVQAAVTEANKAVSTAEAIKKFVILPEDWTEAGGQLTPSLKVKRNIVQAQYAAQISELFDGPK